MNTLDIINAAIKASGMGMPGASTVILLNLKQKIEGFDSSLLKAKDSDELISKAQDLAFKLHTLQGHPGGCEGKIEKRTPLVSNHTDFEPTAA